ncbi:glycosyltransferase family 9 protein [Celeribacter sp.]|uniref:glycosyltransferase family 9 protein n=1 Tax=Celeribacter sp. TaxID=1890673 RepID=UPI003A8CCD14
MIDPSRKPVIIYRLGSLGDTIFALPCFHAIRRAFPDRRIVLLTNMPVSGKAAPLMAVLGDDGQFADDVIEYPVSLRAPREALVLAQRLRAHNAEALVYLMPQRSRAQAWRDWTFLRFAAGIKRILCFPDSDDLRSVRVNPDTGVREREAARLIRTCAQLGPIDIADRANWDLRYTQTEQAQAAAISAPLGTAPFVAVNMGGKAEEKDWGMANWRALGAALQAAYPHIGLMVVGAGEDHARGEAFKADWRAPAVNACGALTARASGAALSRAALFIGHDSGPLHLAACSNTPSIGIFGNFNAPKQWHPVGAHVRVIHEMRGLAHITPQDVMENIHVLLDGRDIGAGGQE